MAALPLAATIPVTAYALSMARLQRLGPASDPHVEEHHWAAMATMAVALVLVALLSSLRMPGWRLSARCAAIGTMVFGLASVVYPNYPGSAGDVWGIAALIGGAVFLGVAEWEARRSPARG
ncbi:MAG: hypothetical protein LC722_02225 [Actinobacteria bacterium]|nr:hypothetical protein [Actinomycetota bacterium]